MYKRNNFVIYSYIEATVRNGSSKRVDQKGACKIEICNILSSISNVSTRVKKQVFFFIISSRFFSVENESLCRM